MIQSNRYFWGLLGALTLLCLMGCHLARNPVMQANPAQDIAAKELYPSASHALVYILGSKLPLDTVAEIHIGANQLGEFGRGQYLVCNVAPGKYRVAVRAWNEVPYLDSKQHVTWFDSQQTKEFLFDGGKAYYLELNLRMAALLTGPAAHNWRVISSNEGSSLLGKLSLSGKNSFQPLGSGTVVADSYSAPNKKQDPDPYSIDRQYPAQVSTSKKQQKYYALVLGNNKYQSFPTLKTAESDAVTVSRRLVQDYGFEAQILLNGTRFDILNALDQLRAKLTAQDNLMIYYAGHGFYDQKAGRGYWLPVDAHPNTAAN